MGGGSEPDGVSILRNCQAGRGLAFTFCHCRLSSPTIRFYRSAFLTADERGRSGRYCNVNAQESRARCELLEGGPVVTVLDSDLRKEHRRLSTTGPVETTRHHSKNTCELSCSRGSTTIRPRTDSSSDGRPAFIVFDLRFRLILACM